MTWASEPPKPVTPSSLRDMPDTGWPTRVTRPAIDPVGSSSSRPAVTETPSVVIVSVTRAWVPLPNTSTR